MCVGDVCEVGREQSLAVWKARETRRQGSGGYFLSRCGALGREGTSRACV